MSSVISNLKYFPDLTTHALSSQFNVLPASRRPAASHVYLPTTYLATYYSYLLLSWPETDDQVFIRKDAESAGWLATVASDALRRDVREKYQVEKDEMGFVSRPQSIASH